MKDTVYDLSFFQREIDPHVTWGAISSRRRGNLIVQARAGGDVADDMAVVATEAYGYGSGSTLDAALAACKASFIRDRDARARDAKLADTRADDEEAPPCSPSS